MSKLKLDTKFSSLWLVTTEIDFVDIPPFLRIALLVATATMHFHIAQTVFF